MFTSHLLFFLLNGLLIVFVQLKKIIYLFACLLYLWLCWVFPAVRGPSLVMSGAALVAEHRLTVVAALVVEHGLQGRQTSAAVVHRLGCPSACGIFLDQGSNCCPLNCKEDS